MPRPSLQRAHDDPAARQVRRRQRLHQELAVRDGRRARHHRVPDRLSASARIGLPIHLAAGALRAPPQRRVLSRGAKRTHRARPGLRPHARGHCPDQRRALLAGGLAAAQFIGVYLIVAIYAGITFSSRACLVATAAATVSYVTIVALQTAGVLSAPFELPNAATIATFNLIILNIAGGLTAVLVARAAREPPTSPHDLAGAGALRRGDPRRHLRRRPRGTLEPLESAARDRDRSPRGRPQGPAAGRAGGRGGPRGFQRGARLGPRGHTVRGRGPPARRRRCPHGVSVDGCRAHGRARPGERPDRRGS